MKQISYPILTITGSDSTGVSGAQADIQTISELGCCALTAITSVTVQTTLGIQEFYDLPALLVEGQIEAVMNDVQPQVVKIGMIRRLDVVDAVVRTLMKYRPPHVVYAPVACSANGEQLMSEELMGEIKRRLLPLCTLVVSLNDMTMHGQANRYASAVAVRIAQGCTYEEAQRQAQAYVQSLMAREGALQGRCSELYKEFVGAVESCHRTNSDVRFYADRLNVSSRYLAQVTRRIASQSPKAIIDECLLREVKSALTHTDKSIKEIAFYYGFGSQAHFTKFFKRFTGQSPTQYRQSSLSPSGL